MKKKFLISIVLGCLIISTPTVSFGQNRRRPGDSSASQQDQLRRQQEAQRRAQEEAYRKQQEEQQRRAREEKIKQLKREAEQAEREYQKRQQDVKKWEPYGPPADYIKKGADAAVEAGPKIAPDPATKAGAAGIELIYKGVTKSILDPQGTERREKIIKEQEARREEERQKRQKWNEEILRRQQEFNRRLYQ